MVEVVFPQAGTILPASPTLSRAAAASAIRTIEIEREALQELGRCLERDPLRDQFEQVAKVILAAQGRVVLSGMGKSGLIARKIAATFASTGTPALFIHPADASHGDLGMITAMDVMILLSWSGETVELSDIVGYCRRFNVPLIAMTASTTSTLAQKSEFVLALPRVREACPNALAPTSSTAMQLALGDALAVALIELRGFSPRDFYVLHPKGRLGASLVTVGELMTTAGQVPQITETTTILGAVLEMTSKRFGGTAVVNDKKQLVGAFTDGDLRRSLSIAEPSCAVGAYMSKAPFYVAPSMLASEALTLMNSRQILQLFICDDDQLVGIIHLHDILRANVV